MPGPDARSGFLVRAILTVLAGLVCLFMPGRSLAWYSAKYTESAHGSTTYGVYRTDASEYSRGNCAHCHVMHGSGGANSFTLFYANNPTSQDDNFCFQCHTSSGSEQQGGVVNYTYSKGFGGGTATFTSIKDAFNPDSGSTPSSHNLSDILTHIVGRDIGYTTNNNPCTVCHNPHADMRNLPVTGQALGGINTALRRSIDHQDAPTNRWGDESANNELMSEYAGTKYQAPYFKNTPLSTFEPADDSTSDGSNLPNYKNFCMNQCHGTNTVYSTERTRNLFKILWDNTSGHDAHGKWPDDPGLGGTKAPYSNASFNYALSCLDCHEPHGSKNEWLLRTCVNGVDNIDVPGPGRWLDFCSACHTISQHTAPWNTTTNCNNSGVCHQHGQYF